MQYVQDTDEMINRYLEDHNFGDLYNVYVDSYKIFTKLRMCIEGGEIVYHRSVLLKHLDIPPTLHEFRRLTD